MAKYKIINGEGIIPNGTTEIEDNAFKMSSELKSITIPNSVTKIGTSAFDGCKSLTSINIPNSVTKIGDSAFEWCEELESITIPNSVTEIGCYAFDECEALTSIIVAEGNKVYDSRGNCNAIIETETNRLIQGCANTVIPESVTEIGDSAFEGCKALTSVTIPNSVTKIGGGAFESCWNLEELILCHTDPTEIWVEEDAFLFAEECTLYVPKESLVAVLTDSFWSQFAAIKPITDDMLK